MTWYCTGLGGGKLFNWTVGCHARSRARLPQCWSIPAGKSIGYRRLRRESFADSTSRDGGRERERKETGERERRRERAVSREPFSYLKASVIDLHVRYMADTHFIDTTNFSTSVERTMAECLYLGHASFSHERWSIFPRRSLDKLLTEIWREK